ncbi:MAG: hypothetical protein ABW157_08095 [Candidatus Thiodiazotropha sp. LLP2]
MSEKSKDNQSQGTIMLWIAAAILLIAISVVAVYKAWPMLFPEISQSAVVDPQCDLRQGPCISSINTDVQISFSIQPQEIPLVKPLKLHVQVKGVNAHKVEVDFVGVDMNMGFNRVVLQQYEAGLYEGDGMIPVCVRDSMEWEAKVLITTDQGLLSAPYRFITVRPGIPLP